VAAYRFVGSTIVALARLIAAPMGYREGSKALGHAAELIVPVRSVPTAAGEIRFACPSVMSARMPISSFHGEPETSAWIDRCVLQGECLWDIGANVGNWSLYAAKTKRARVIAFEPSAQTFGTLYRNIALNGLGERISAYCIALSGETELGTLYLRNASPGEANHGYGAATGVAGDFEAQFEQAAVSFRIDDFIKAFSPPPPRHIKLDVDGVEDRILDGASATLQGVQSVLVELEAAPRTARGLRICARLNAAGLHEDARLAGRMNKVFLRGST
jgi:FkbM family methyltransferase